ncbi:MAG: riboflavin synthase [Tatlockia sp.]|nr:riboflavin synthase [Tatlockia sp.]
MFTGLVDAMGEVLVNQFEKLANRLEIKSDYQQLSIGESISVNGVCLTLVPESESKDRLIFDVSPETLRLTNLGQLKAGDKVNLERAMLATARFGGHYVSGHIDTTARLKAKSIIGDYVELIVGDFAAPASIYLLPKGSIALDGVSLTINVVNADDIQLMLVPHTLAQTTLGQFDIGQRLNVEFDYLTRIVAHQLQIAGQLNEVETI